MRSIKRYSQKIVLLLIALGSTAIFYWYGFHKTFDKKCIPKNADAVVILDVKNMRNYFAYSILQNPTEWPSIAKTSGIKKRLDLSNFGIEIADYYSFFHVENQPVHRWFVVAKIEDVSIFNQALVKAHFVKTKINQTLFGYYSKSLKLLILQDCKEILCCLNAANLQQNDIQIAENLFRKHRYFDFKKIEKSIESSNALTIWIKKNNMLQDDGIINVALGEQEITARGKLVWKSEYQKTNVFIQNPNALCSFGINFGMIRNQNLFRRHLKQINSIVGFNINSILAHHPTKTEFIFNGMVEKKDSAISYQYDEDFNPIQKVIVHYSREPSFFFSIQTDTSSKVFAYLKSQKVIDNHQVFVNFPLAVTKVFVKNNSLAFEANFSKSLEIKNTVPKIAYLQIHFNKIQPNDWNFLIKKNKKISFLKPFKSFEMTFRTINNSENFQARLVTKRKKNIVEILN